MTCIRCGEHPAAQHDLCANCAWAVSAEFEAGYQALRVYLRGWWLFTDWLLAHGQTL